MVLPDDTDIKNLKSVLENVGSFLSIGKVTVKSEEICQVEMLQISGF